MRRHTYMQEKKTKFKVWFTTSRYKPHKASVQNWEPGTKNCHMKALDGWSSVEPDERALRWRLWLFQGGPIPSDPEEYEQYKQWRAQPINKIEFWDSYCEMDRVTEPTPPGFKQGAALQVDKIMAELRTRGIAIIPFSQVYDSRQYDHHMDGCELLIVALN